MNNLLKNVLKEIKPGSKELEKERKIEREIIKKIQSMKGKHVKVVLAGSVARNTHLKNDRDLDFFVMFPTNLSRKDFEKEGLRIAKKVLKGYAWEEVYSEHPYIKANYKSFDIEIVPTYQIKDTSKLMSAVDRTPFHNEYLKEKLTEKQKDEIRLLKKFLKNLQAYGADIKANSFSGYLTEILILNYGSFEKVLKNASEWKKQTIIDLSEKWLEVNAKVKFDSPLIVIDPTDYQRNVAAAVSTQQFSRFIGCARAFLKKPGKKFFFGQKTKPWPLRKASVLLKEKDLIFLCFPYPKLVEDLVWGQIRRLRRKISNQLSLNDFKVLNGSEFIQDKKQIIILIELESHYLNKVVKHFGPEVTDKKNSEIYLQAHKKPVNGPRVEGSKWVIEKLRTNNNSFDLVKNYLKDFNKQPDKNPELTKALKKNYKLLDSKQVLLEYKKNKEFQNFLTTYLKGKEEFLDY
ncbi:MAG: CCA tRNA nucleotidyltransferase [archaeon]